MDYYYLAGLRDSRCDIGSVWGRAAGGGSACASVAECSCKCRDPTKGELNFGDREHYVDNLRVI